MNDTELGYAKRRLIDKIITDNWNINSPQDKKYSYDEMIFVLQEFFTEEGKKYLTKDKNKNAFQVFNYFVELLLYRNLANYDSMILITSDKGTGKSSAAIMLARKWCKLIGIKFDPNRHMAYNNADITKKINSLKPFEPIIADEAVRFASASDWAKKESKELKKKLAQVRTKHLLYILCFPLKIQKLEKTYLESFVNYWVDLFARGKGAIYVKDKNPSMDSWRIKAFEKLGSYNEFTLLNNVQKQLKKHPNFWQIIKFPKVPDAIYNKYLEVREKNVYDDESVFASITKEDIQKSLLILSLRDIMMQDSTLTMNRIILHIKNQYDISLSKNAISILIDDSRQLISKIKGELTDGLKYE